MSFYIEAGGGTRSRRRRIRQRHTTIAPITSWRKSNGTCRGQEERDPGANP
jgi:hypothetical protein